MSNNIGYIGELTNIDLNTLVKPIHTGVYGCNESSFITSYNHYPDDTAIIEKLINTTDETVKNFSTTNADGSFAYSDTTLRAIYNHMIGTGATVIQGNLEVICVNDGSFCMQRFYRINDNTSFTRVYDGTWGDWSYEESYRKYTQQYANSNNNIRDDDDIREAINKYQPAFDDTALKNAINSKASITDANDRLNRAGDSTTATYNYMNGVRAINNSSLRMKHNTGIYYNIGGWRGALRFPGDNQVWVGSSEIATVLLWSRNTVRAHWQNGYLGTLLCEDDFNFKQCGWGKDIYFPAGARDIVVQYMRSNGWWGVIPLRKGTSSILLGDNFRWGGFGVYDGGTHVYLTRDLDNVYMRVLWR